MQMDRKKHSRLRGHLVRGIAVLFPFYLTVIMIRFLIETISKPLSHPIRWIARLLAVDIKAHPSIENVLVIGTSLLITLGFIMFVGILAQRVFGRRIMKFFEATFERLPLINTVYRTFREFTRILTGESVEAYKKVVQVGIPGSSGKMLGFVTGTMIMDDNQPYLIVFLPTAPNVSTGFLMFLPAAEVTETSLTTEEAFKLIVSIGIINHRTNIPFDPKGT